ncbi:hypothetical protein JG688_00008953 [Phytophthora aleatoria]|uniref:Transmembrane protein n=1 Tax=Phytophthora aleatoria TaxID=2496075 RepID=A0A8J5MG23_9STRA|nr:hypothetical protein JG688_00008953 [Phytophthora aleatoria]
MLGFQVIVELVVDFVATALEKMVGIEFAMDKKVAAFLTIFLAAIAVLNINISAGAYPNCEIVESITTRGVVMRLVRSDFDPSTLAKLILQESAKHLVIKKRIRSIRVMCILVAVPTVLIDTQARIVLLGTQDTDMAAAGIFGMAILEIGVRIGFELWRHQRQAYHTAELNADMYAKYIAIGCSASILFFYSNHPHYSLLRPLKASMSESEVAARKMSQLHKLLLQVVVEIVVDYTSIVLEITAGIEFDRIKGLGSFLAALFGTTAVINIIISAMMFLD